MTDKQFSICVSEVDNYSDRDAYVSDLALSSIWEDEGAEIPQSRIDTLGQIWDAVKRSPRDILEAAGMTQAGFAERFCIPRRTVESWCSRSEAERREAPVYVRLLIQEQLGLLSR